MKRDVDKLLSALESTSSLLYRLKIWWTLVHKRFKKDRKFQPPFVICAFYTSSSGFAHGSRQTELKLRQTEGRKWRRCQPNKVAPHSECKWNHRNYVAGVPGPKNKKRFWVRNDIESGGLKWQFRCSHIFYIVVFTAPRCYYCWVDLQSQ